MSESDDDLLEGLLRAVAAGEELSRVGLVRIDGRGRKRVTDDSRNYVRDTSGNAARPGEKTEVKGGDLNVDRMPWPEDYLETYDVKEERAIRSMYAQVLLNGLRDAEKAAAKSEGSRTAEEQVSFLYLSGPSADLAMICELLDLDMDAVLSAARKRLGGRADATED